MSFASSDIVIEGIPVECDLHNSKKGFDCYSSVKIDGVSYGINEPVLITDKNDLAIARIICIYVYKNEDVKVLIRKHIFSRNIPEIFEKQAIEYAEENEVVQDLSKNYIIDVEQMLRKCALIIMHPDDDPYEIMENNNLNPEADFMCRFTLQSKKLVPTLTLLSTNDFLLNKLATKQKIGDETTPQTYGDDLKQVSVDKENIFSPPQRNSVRRNLNKSFGNSPRENDRSILNYSIVDLTEDDDEGEEKRLIVRLRVSNKDNTPADKETVEQQPEAKRSVRQLPRKSYADYISPKKTTPTKRQHSRHRTEDEVTESTRVGRSTPKKEKATPRSSTRRRPETSRSLNINPEPFTSSGRMVKTPQRFEYAPLPARIGHTTPRRSTRASRNLSVDYKQLDGSLSFDDLSKSLKGNSKNTEIDKDEQPSPVAEKSINLDDSIRTTMLKVHLKNLKIDKEEYEAGKKALSSELTDSEDSEKSAAKDTPQRRRRRTRTVSIDTDTESSDSYPVTPKKTPRMRKENVKQNATRQTSKSAKTPKTPKNVLKLIREGVVTPTMQARSKSVTGDTTPLMRARSQLHVSYLPKSLPCRENEYSNVYNFLEGKLLDGCGGCMYVSGVPGTGKTATVTSVINALQCQKNIPDFSYVSVNGMRLTEPRQAYVEIVKQLLGKTVPWEQAQTTLEDLFVKSKKLKPVVMLIDELDILCTKRQDVVYNLLDWPTKAKNQLIVVTIANTMDLPERLLMSRVTSRLGLTRLSFQAYTHKQLQEIVTERLSGTNSFNPDAVQLVARKVASVSGDARRALDICRRAAEIAESEGKGQLVNMNHVNEALNAMITQPKVRAIKSCSRAEQLILQSIVAEVERTGVEETNFSDVYKMLIACAAIDGFQIISTTIALAIVARLSACRLILTDQKCNDIYQRIILNVSSDDVYYALKRD